jgi:hypothetical protein
MFDDAASRDRIQLSAADGKGDLGAVKAGAAPCDEPDPVPVQLCAEGGRENDRR